MVCRLQMSARITITTLMLAPSMLPVVLPLQHRPSLLVPHRPRASRQAAVLQPHLLRPLLKQLLRARPLLLPQPPVSYVRQVRLLQECLEITSACVTSLANMRIVPLGHAYVLQLEHQFLHLRRQVLKEYHSLGRMIATLVFVVLLVAMDIVLVRHAQQLELSNEGGVTFAVLQELEFAPGC